MDLSATFAAMPNAARLGGLPGSWYWTNTPGTRYGMVAALSADGTHAFQAFALDSYDEGLAVALLAFAREHGAELIAAPERPLVLVEGFHHPGYAFDAVVAIGPGIHRYHRERPEVNQAVRALLPAFRCEFAGDENEVDTAYRYNRAPGVPGTRWGREPRPFMKMRYRDHTGRIAAKRGFSGLRLLASWITRNEGNPDLYVECENYRHEVRTVEWTDTWTLTAPGAAPRPIALADLLDTLRTALYGPNLAAGTGEFPG